MAFESKRQLLISRGWVQAVAIVMIFGFTVMGMLAFRTYTGEPPISARYKGSSYGPGRTENGCATPRLA